MTGQPIHLSSSEGIFALFLLLWGAYGTVIPPSFRRKAVLASIEESLEIYDGTEQLERTLRPAFSRLPWRC